MKKSLHLIAAFALAFSVMETKAQLADGSTAPNFTFTDMNGNTQDLYTYLNAGKAVVLDISATWCGPCWNYHNSQNLENFYNQYGPPGTNVAMVIFIEGDGATTNADMNGTGSNTQGNWVSGTPYPMCNPATAQINPFNTAYNIGYFPTMYLICPDKKTTDVDQYTTAQLVAKMNAKCPAPTGALDAGIPSVTAPSGTLCGVSSFIPTVVLKNFGSTPLTSCTINYHLDSNPNQTFAWTGSLTTGQTATVNLPSMSVTAGAHSFTAYTSAPNGGADGLSSNDQSVSSFNVNTTGMTLPLQEGFESSSNVPAGWTINDMSSDGFKWVVSTTVGKTGTHSMAFDNCNPSTDITNTTDRFITTSYDLSNATSASISFDVAAARLNLSSTIYSDALTVYASSNCGTTWTQIYSKTGTALATAPDMTAASPTCFVPTGSQWRNDVTSLNSYIGQPNVMFAFENKSGWAEWLYVDNINITAVTGIAESNVSDYVSVFPNPTSGNVFVNITSPNMGKVDVKIMNIMGQSVIESKENSAMNMKFDLSAQPNGMYTVEVNTAQGRMIQKVLLNK